MNEQETSDVTPGLPPEPTPSQAPEQSSAPVVPKHQPFFKTGKGKAVLLLLVVAIGLGFLTREVYSRPVTDGFVKAVARVLPLPAVRVNGSLITINQYLMEYDALINSLETTLPEGSDLPSGSEIEEAILDTLINKEVIRQLAQENGVKIDEERVEEYYGEIIAAQDSEEAFAQELSETFGWTTEAFKERIVESIVLALQMSDFVLQSEEVQEERRSFIDAALTRVEDGDPFELVAKEMHEVVDPSLEADLGYVPFSQIPSSWADAVDALEVDAHTQALELPEGYAIFKLLDRVSGQDEDQLQLQAITIPKVTLEDVVDAYLEQANVKRYL